MPINGKAKQALVYVGAYHDEFGDDNMRNLKPVPCLALRLALYSAVISVNFLLFKFELST